MLLRNLLECRMFARLGLNAKGKSEHIWGLFVQVRGLYGSTPSSAVLWCTLFTGQWLALWSAPRCLRGMPGGNNRPGGTVRTDIAKMLLSQGQPTIRI